MDTTPQFSLPYILPSQAQKHVTHNEAIRILDAIAQISVAGIDVNDPPGTPQEGDRVIVGDEPTGAFAGHDGALAMWIDGAWMFHAPREGWLVWNEAEEELLARSGDAWTAVGSDPETADIFGINTTADTTNRLTVSADASLFTNAGSDHRIKINKAAAGDTASVLFQDGYSGRAEFGLAGDDDFHVKVSDDGTVWREAIIIDAATGSVAFPLTPGLASGIDGGSAASTYTTAIDGGSA